MNTFSELNINENLISGLNSLDIKKPTHIQELSIPLILENKNVIGESETGSGKTLAYLLPILNNLNANDNSMQALILAPTHELTMQINSVIKEVSNASKLNIKSMGIIGDVNIDKQIKKIKETKPQIVVGTPGRVMDLIKKKKITPHTLKNIVIDEADNLLDNTSSNMVIDIVKKAMKSTTLSVFSASINEKTIELVKSLRDDLEILKSTTKLVLNKNIEHIYIKVEKRTQFETLRKLLAAENPTKALIFVNSNYDLNNFTEKLNFHNKTTFCLHKGISKEQRQNALESFRNGKINILVSSDLSARGLDIKEITHVINLDFPKRADEYVHRVGRTARNGNSGIAISLVTTKELPTIKIYEKKFNIKINEKKLSYGKLI